MDEDHELGVLLSLDGFEFQFVESYRVRITARRGAATSTRPHGIRYSLTLHDPGGRRIYGIDNAHRATHGRPEFDHRHGTVLAVSLPMFTGGRSSSWKISIGKSNACCGSWASDENQERNVSTIQGSYAGDRARRTAPRSARSQEMDRATARTIAGLLDRRSRRRAAADRGNRGIDNPNLGAAAGFGLGSRPGAAAVRPGGGRSRIKPPQPHRVTLFRTVVGPTFRGCPPAPTRSRLRWR